MRCSVHTALTAAIGCLALSAFSGAARAQVALESQSTMVIGSFAPSCYEAAKAYRTDQDSVDLCTRALETDILTEHDRAATYVNRGVIYIGRNQGDPAIEDFDRAIKILPDIGEAHVNRGAALMLMRRYSEAIKDITKGIELNTRQPEKAYYDRGLSREMVDDVRGAYADYMQAQALKPDWDMPAHELTRFKVKTKPGEAPAAQ